MTSPRQAISQIRKFKEFLGKRVWRLFLAAILIGACLFLIESSFIFVMQGFLRAVKLVDADKLSLPAWYPTSLFSTILLLTLFGVFRGIAFSLRTYVAGLTFQVFNRIQRSRILEYGLTHADKVTSHEIIELFTERVGSAGTSLGGLSGFLMNGTSAVLLLALGTKLAPKEMMLGIFLLLLLVYPLKWMGAKVHSYGENLLIDWRQANRILLEGMRNNFLLRVYDLIPREVAEGQNHLGRFEQHYKKYYSTHSIKSSIPIIAGVLEISTITYVSIHFIGTPPIRLIGFFYIFIRLAQTAAEMNATLSEFRLHLPGFKLLYSWHLKMAEANASRAPAVRPDGTEIPGPPCDRRPLTGRRLVLSRVRHGEIVRPLAEAAPPLAGHHHRVAPAAFRLPVRAARVGLEDERHVLLQLHGELLGPALRRGDQRAVIALAAAMHVEGELGAGGGAALGHEFCCARLDQLRQLADGDAG
ncbi:MAG: hypothetical protein ACXVCS_22185, partial [Bdellovibrionota bacterium]